MYGKNKKFCYEISTAYWNVCEVTLSSTESDAEANAKKKNTIPLQAWTGPEGSSRLRRPDFKIIGT